MPGSSILTVLSPILTITRHTFLKLIAKKRSPQQENSDSSSEDDMPLSKYQLHKPSVGEKLPNVAETQFLAQYIEKRNAELKNRNSTDNKTSSDIQPVRQVREMPKAKAEPEHHNATSRDEEKTALIAQLQAEKKKREVLSAEKIVVETKHSTLQKMLEIERQKIISLEDEKRELAEALEAAKSEYGTLQAMHERV